MGPSLGEQRTAIWSDLPTELAGLILGRLLSQDDRLSFLSVCRQWRRASQQQHPLPPALPWFCRFNDDDSFFQSLPGGELHTLRDNCLGCFDSWLFCVHNNDTGTCFLVNPSTRKTIEITECRFPEGFSPDFPYPLKMIVCSPDLVAGASGVSGAVAFYRLGDVSLSICPPYSRRGWYVDIAFLHGKLYTLSLSEELFVHDLIEDSTAAEEARASRVDHEIKAGPPVTNRQDEVYYTRSYLVAACSNLLMVRIGGSRDKLVEKVALKVLFKADLDAGRWSEVKNLDGAMLSSSAEAAPSPFSCRMMTMTGSKGIVYTS
ncbi:hypothetical protein BAE44_0021304 [Dichanthelium oligosanthes]|uniref:F-box domain-containing protein n=1 Tax=Dichanthelium oligosanthes TaxID=888268 RepID=A0A1E5UXU1_9POAL|nr:hypothetical protein BAE44_0021304 [Dichanthelium oligosanthes]